MGKTIFVKDLERCNKCGAKNFAGCYLSLACTNQVRMTDNNLPNRLSYALASSCVDKKVTE